MANSPQAKSLPSSVWPSKVIPPPPTAFAITQILAFFDDLGYSKTVKALRKEATSNGVDMDSPEVNALRGPFKKSLGELYADALLQEDSDDESSEDSTSDEPEQEDAETSDSDSDSSSSSEEKEPLVHASSSSSSSSEDSSESSSDESDAEEPKEVKAPPAALKRKRSDTSSLSSSSEDSDSDSDESVAPPAKKTKVAATKKASSPATSDDSESESDVSTSEASSDSESSSDDSDSSDAEEEDQKTPTTSTQPKASESDSEASSATLVASPVKEDNHGDMHPSRAIRMNPPATIAADKTKKTNVPFSRIPKNTPVDPRFASNAYVSYDYADRAHQDLIVTKGKGFTKEKNKKKRGSYRGGFIDTTPKGIKFDD